MKPLAGMVAATAIGIAIGFLVGRRSHSDPPSKTTSSLRAERPSRAKDRLADPGPAGGSLLRGRDPATLSDAELREVVERGWSRDFNEDPVVVARRDYEFQVFLAGLPADKLRDLFKGMFDEDSQGHSRSLQILGAWVRSDPEAALAWADGNPRGGEWLQNVIISMAKYNPDLAEKLMNERLDSGLLTDRAMSEIGFRLAYSKARMGKEALLTYLESLPPRLQMGGTGGALDELPKDELRGFVDDLYRKRESTTLTPMYLKYAFSKWMAVDPDAATGWMAKLEPGKERAEFEQGAVEVLARKGKTLESATIMKRMLEEDPAQAEKQLKSIVATLGAHGPEAINEFMALMPENLALTADSFKGARFQGFNEQGGLFDQARAIRSPAEKAKLLTTVLGEVARSAGRRNSFSQPTLQEMERFEKRFHELNLPAAEAGEISEMLETVRKAIRNGGTQ